MDIEAFAVLRAHWFEQADAAPLDPWFVRGRELAVERREVDRHLQRHSFERSDAGNDGEQSAGLDRRIELLGDLARQTRRLGLAVLRFAAGEEEDVRRSLLAHEQEASIRDDRGCDDDERRVALCVLHMPSVAVRPAVACRAAARRTGNACFRAAVRGSRVAALRYGSQAVR
jgi:hypothetical protein